MKTQKHLSKVLLIIMFLAWILILSKDVRATGGMSIPQNEEQISKLLPEGGGNIKVYLPLLAVPGESSWSMVGANPERTSWTPTEIKGKLNIAWFKPFDSFILPRTQIIGANGLLYISTAHGLYALDADSGEEVWVYPTEMPLGHSPTIYKGVAYVGGFDKKIHAINAFTGVGLWTFEAGAGFDTNPLIVNDILYTGNRDGVFYAIHTTGPNAGELLWDFSTGAPIHYSAAYKDGVVFFASNTSKVYALNAQTGSVVWQTGVLPGSGFHSWWPVIYEDYVIVAGSHNYRFSSELGPGNIIGNEKMELYPNYDQDPRGTLIGPISTTPGDWVSGTPTIDASKPVSTPNGQTQPITEYLESKPWRRTYFVFNRFNGQEYTTDFDNDGKAEYAPFLVIGIKGGGNRYPPIVGGDALLYQANNYMSDPSIAGGHLTGWQPGSKYFSIISSDWGAVDEPYAYSGGGDVIYWNLCCDRQIGAIDTSIPNVNFIDRYNAGVRPPTGAIDPTREWMYLTQDLDVMIPGYNEKYFGGPNETYANFGTQNGVYGYHGNQNPPIPFNGMLYVHRGNSVIAFTPDDVNYEALPMAEIVPAPDQTTPIPKEELEERLITEVEKILDAGHLMPGYTSSGILDLRARFDCGDDLVDYWHSPGDIHQTLLSALPHLPLALRTETLAYLLSEFAAFPPYAYNHIGWKDGASRDVFVFPPEVETARLTYPPKVTNPNFEGWEFSPFGFYAMWKYAEEFGNAQVILNAGSMLLEDPPPNPVFNDMPHVLNAYIAGYNGFLGLEALVGPQTPSIVAQRNNLVALRINTFTKDAPAVVFNEFTKYYCRNLNVSRNFMYLTPELADEMRTNLLPQVQTTLTEYEANAPYWFVTRFEGAFGEGVFSAFYDYHSIFQAKALILQEPYETMVNYLDVPAVPVGDLFYIQNLITLIEMDSD